jgi:hypothetical protein
VEDRAAASKSKRTERSDRVDAVALLALAETDPEAALAALET